MTGDGGMTEGGGGDRRAAGVTDRGRGRPGRGTADGGGSRLSTPHLTSPLKGGRDELGFSSSEERGMNLGGSSQRGEG